MRVSWEGPTWSGRAPEGRSGSAGAVGMEFTAPPWSRAEPSPAWARRSWLTCGGVSRDPAAWWRLAPVRATFLCPEALQVLQGLLLYVLAGLRPGVWPLCPQNCAWSPGPGCLSFPGLFLVLQALPAPEEAVGPPPSPAESAAGPVPTRPCPCVGAPVTMATPSQQVSFRDISRCPLCVLSRASLPVTLSPPMSPFWDGGWPAPPPFTCDCPRFRPERPHSRKPLGPGQTTYPGGLSGGT